MVGHLQRRKRTEKKAEKTREGEKTEKKKQPVNDAQQVNRQLGTTTVVITHNAGIAQMADGVIQLSDGRISEMHTNKTKLSPGELSW